MTFATEQVDKKYRIAGCDLSTFLGAQAAEGYKCTSIKTTNASTTDKDGSRSQIFDVTMTWTRPHERAFR